jgi:tripartite-type tricarboxylate transporter receptor subunit TctC
MKLRWLAVFALVVWAATAHAQTYPTKVVRIIVGYPAGGSNDVVARMLANELTKVWGQQVIVENRAGAAGTIRSKIFVNAPPDGYTLIIGAEAQISSEPSNLK